MNNSKLSELQELSKVYKNKIFQNSFLNSVLLILILLFFSIGFNLTYEVYLNFINLNWGFLFPTIMDLIILYISITTVNKFKKIINSPSYYLDTQNIYSDEELREPVIQFLKKTTLFREMKSNIFLLLFLIVVNFILNAVFHSHNNQLSLWNEWYISSGLFNQLPIFPIIQVLLVVILVFMYPILTSYCNYKLIIAEKINHNDTIKYWQPNSFFFQTQKNAVFIVLIIYCLLMSTVFKRENIWLFKYYNPTLISNIENIEPLIEYKKLCDYDELKTVYKNNVIVYNIEQAHAFRTISSSKIINVFITSSLKNDIEQLCSKEKIKSKT